MEQEAVAETTESQNGQPPVEPWFALPLSDLQSIQNFLQREAISGQEAATLLNKLAQAAPAKFES